MFCKIVWNEALLIATSLCDDKSSVSITVIKASQLFKWDMLTGYLHEKQALKDLWQYKNILTHYFGALSILYMFFFPPLYYTYWYSFPASQIA